MVKHGSATAYKNGCRCDACQKKHRDYMRRYRKRKPEKYLESNSLSSRAAWTLIDRHRSEYEAIRAELKETAGW